MANLTTRKDTTTDSSSLVLNSRFEESPMMENGSDSESDTQSPSLPSLPLSLQQQLLADDTRNQNVASAHSSGYGPGQVVSMKDFDAKLNDLRRENFNLKLRLYFMEKDRNGVTKPECESLVAKELLKREKAIKAFQKIVEDKDIEIDSTRDAYENVVKEKDLEIDTLHMERDAMTRDLKVSTSVCRSLMSHLSEIREFWRKHLLERNGSLGPNDLTSLSQWFNSSEDLLNSASVLITDDGDQSMPRGSVGAFDKTLAGNLLRELYGLSLCHNHNANELHPLGLLPDAELAYSNPQREQLQQLYHLSSDSEDEWSEPDRDVSRSRIGIDDPQLFNFSPVSRPPKPKSKRRVSGMSSMGLLSDISELIGKPERTRRKLDIILKDEVGVQTDLNHYTLDAIFSDYQALLSRESADASVQTQAPQLLSGSTQTEVQPVHEQSVQTDYKVPDVEKGVGTDVLLTNSRGVQCQATPRSSKETEVQVNLLFSQNYEEVGTTDEDSPAFAPIKPKSPKAVGYGDGSSPDKKGSPTLYTYKASLSPAKNGNKGSPPSTLPSKHYPPSSITSPSSPNNDAANNNNERALPFRSCPSTPSSRAPETGRTFNERIVYQEQEEDVFKLPNEKMFAKIKKANIRSSKLLTNRQPENRQPENRISCPSAGKSLPGLSSAGVSSASSSCSSSSYEGKLVPRLIPSSSASVSSLQPKIKQALRLKVNTLSSLDLMDGVNPLSSPDLGLGDSDHDLNGVGLRAYLTLGNYQLLRGQVNEALCVLNSFENLNRDFALRLISAKDFQHQVKPFLSGFAHLLTSSKALCRYFTIEDTNSLLAQLDKMRSKKENMEKAITRQLRKTDKLLKKAKVNLKETQ